GLRRKLNEGAIIADKSVPRIQPHFEIATRLFAIRKLGSLLVAWFDRQAPRASRATSELQRQIHGLRPRSIVTNGDEYVPNVCCTGRAPQSDLAQSNVLLRISHCNHTEISWDSAKPSL